MCLLAATTSACVKSKTSIVYSTDTTTHTTTPSAGPTGPLDSRKLVASDAAACPLLSATDAAQLGGDATRERRPAGLQRHEDDVGQAVVALDDLVGDAGHGAAQVVGAHDLGACNKNGGARRHRSLAFSHSTLLRRSSLTGPDLRLDRL